MKKEIIAMITIIGLFYSCKRDDNNSKDTLKDGLIAYYPFNGNVNDTSENSYNASFNMSEFGVDRFGKANSALSCQSNYDVVLIPDEVFSNYIKGTISIWVKTTDSQIGSTFWNSPCLFGADITGYNDSVFNIITQNGEIGIWGQLNTPGQDDKFYSNKSINDNQWHFILVKINDNDSTRLFVDNEYLGAIPSKNPIAKRQYAIMGSGPTKTDFHTGFVDDVRIYNRVLNKSEISILYNER